MASVEPSEHSLDEYILLIIGMLKLPFIVNLTHWYGLKVINSKFLLLSPFIDLLKPTRAMESIRSLYLLGIRICALKTLVIKNRSSVRYLMVTKVRNLYDKYKLILWKNFKKIF